VIIKFINRKEDLDFLEKKYREKSAQLIVIYGRRRVGKTELVKQFFRDKPHIYFLATRTTTSEQINQFVGNAYDAIEDDTILELRQEWETVFKHLSRTKERLIIVVDEFPYLIEGNKAITSIFQKIQDSYLVKSNIYLILMGSSISMMENEVLGYKSPLYGRRTGQWKVEPLKFGDVRKFFPDYPIDKHVEIYSILGGIPFYLQEFDPSRGVFTNIKEKILTKGEILYEETEFLLMEELREPRIYLTILKAISHGNSKFGNIINAAGLDKSTASRYLGILERLHIIRRDVPVTERRPEKSKKGIYVITDPYVRFWLRFVLPNKSRIEEDMVSAFNEKVKPYLSQFVALGFEGVAKETLMELSKRRELPMNIGRIGKWWHGDEEIDIVALNDRTKEILFTECKWQDKKVGKDVAENLLRKKELVDWNKDRRKEHFAIFSKSGFQKSCIEHCQENGILMFDLKDVESASAASN